MVDVEVYYGLGISAAILLIMIIILLVVCSVNPGPQRTIASHAENRQMGVGTLKYQQVVQQPYTVYTRSRVISGNCQYATDTKPNQDQPNYAHNAAMSSHLMHVVNGQKGINRKLASLLKFIRPHVKVQLPTSYETSNSYQDLDTMAVLLRLELSRTKVLLAVIRKTDVSKAAILNDSDQFVASDDHKVLSCIASMLVEQVQATDQLGEFLTTIQPGFTPRTWAFSGLETKDLYQKGYTYEQQMHGIMTIFQQAHSYFDGMLTDFYSHYNRKPEHTGNVQVNVTHDNVTYTDNVHPTLVKWSTNDRMRPRLDI